MSRYESWRSDIHSKCLDIRLDALTFIWDVSMLWYSFEISRYVSRRSDIHSKCLDVIASASRYKSLTRMSVWVKNLISSTQGLLFFYIYIRYISAFDWSLQWFKFTEADSCRHFFQFCCLAIFDSLVYFKMRLLRSITYTFIVKLSHSKSQSKKIDSCESTKILQILISIFLHIQKFNDILFVATFLSSFDCDLEDSTNTLLQVTLLSCWSSRVIVTCQTWKTLKCFITVAYCQRQVFRVQKHLKDRTNEDAKNRWMSHKFLKTLTLLWWGTSIQNLLRMSANILNHQLLSNDDISDRLSWSEMTTAMLFSTISRQ